MRTIRPIHRFGAALAGLAVVATPVALAAPALDDASSGDDAKPEKAAAEPQPQKTDPDIERTPEPDRFHPIVIKAVDYGAADAGFGAARSGHVHEGQDVFAPSGTPLVAVSDGEVVETGSDGGRGNYLSIHDPDAGRTYNYFHMVAPAKVSEGDRVKAGQQVGAVGCTGSCWGDHLHFEVHEGSDPYGPAVDPMGLLKKLPQAEL
jgi:murein DD-endopeptidase MepM/ murein hydrolase activator NlpD